MSKKEKVKVSSPEQIRSNAPYYQPYQMSEYIPSTYQSNVVYQNQISQQPTVFQAPTVVLPTVKKVIQGETIHQQPLQENVQCCYSPRTQASQVVTKQYVMRQCNKEEYSKKLDEIERLHNQEIKELELKFQNQMDQIMNQNQLNEQNRQITDLRQTVTDLKSQLSQSRVSQYQQQPTYSQPQYDYKQIEKLEKKVKKQKNKIKDYKDEITKLKNEIQHKNGILSEYELRLQSAEGQLKIQRERIVHVNEPPHNLIVLERERDGLLNELRMLKGQNDQLRQDLFIIDQEKARMSNDLNKFANDCKQYEQSNQKLTLILNQKEELVKVLEQRLSNELSRNSLLLSSQSPQRVVVEQVTRPVQFQPPSQQQYIITDQYQYPQTMQPTLVQSLPKVKIEQQIQQQQKQ